VRETCEVMINHDQFGISCESHECGAPAVDFYVTEDGKAWLCSLHWDEHIQCWGGSCAEYCAKLSRLEKQHINKARKDAGKPPLYDDQGGLLREARR